ncbi:hypothetical protein G7Y79_00009g026790 [Physcia stellaris]|nr:hypothetical protein G7Y79_00009g026790 [Physcia stellaris]
MSTFLTRSLDCFRLEDPRQLDVRSLYHSLSKQQIRDLKALIESTDFRFDIIANLPIELVTFVFQHLELFHTFQFRRVSRRWLEVLSADEVVKTLIRPWTSTEDIKLRTPHPLLSSQQVLDMYAEHQDAFQTGNAFSRIQIPHGQRIHDDVTLFTHAYSHGSLAWVGELGQSDAVYLRDLESGLERTFMPTEREEIDEIVLSETLLVATTKSSRCYIWAHDTSRPPYCLRLTSQCRRNIFRLCKTSFALLQVVPPTSYVPIILWKLRDSWQDQPLDRPPQAAVSHFSTQIETGDSWHDLYIDRTEMHLIVLQSVVDEAKRSNTFNIIHLSAEGKKLFKGSLACSFSKNITWNIHENSPIHKDRFLDIWMVAEINDSDLSDLEGTGATHLRYFLDKKTLHFLEQTTLMHSHGLPGGEMMEMIEVFPWKGIAYFEEARSRANPGLLYHLRVMDLKQGTCSEARMFRPTPCGRSGSYERAIMFLGDEIFLVKLTSIEFVVWCFDKHLHMAGEDQSFREERLRVQRRRCLSSTQQRCGI